MDSTNFKIAVTYLRGLFADAEISLIDDCLIEVKLKCRTNYVYLLKKSDTKNMWMLPNNFSRRCNHYVLGLEVVNNKLSVRYFNSSDAVQIRKNKQNQLVIGG